MTSLWRRGEGWVGEKNHISGYLFSLKCLVEFVLSFVIFWVFV
jgi:hypothetical protein